MSYWWRDRKKEREGGGKIYKIVSQHNNKR